MVWSRCFSVYSYSHPYSFEIEHFTPDETYLRTRLTPSTPLPMEDTPFTLIDSEIKLATAIQEMKTETHIAVDVEVSYFLFKNYLFIFHLFIYLFIFHVFFHLPGVTYYEKLEESLLYSEIVESGVPICKSYFFSFIIEFLRTKRVNFNSLIEKNHFA